MLRERSPNLACVILIAFCHIGLEKYQGFLLENGSKVLPRRLVFKLKSKLLSVEAKCT